MIWRFIDSILIVGQDELQFLASNGFSMRGSESVKKMKIHCLLVSATAPSVGLMSIKWAILHSCRWCEEKVSNQNAFQRVWGFSLTENRLGCAGKPCSDLYDVHVEDVQWPGVMYQPSKNQSEKKILVVIITHQQLRFRASNFRASAGV
jgi:hypothetical protein